MPLYWFSLSFVNQINFTNAVIAFIILHLLVYPSSNGYNSYMDKDEDSIGGVENPMQPTKQLFLVTVVLDLVAIAFAFYISIWFALSIIIYVTFSRLYSYRGVRLKQYPLIGYAVVILNQGALTFFMIYHGASYDAATNVPVHGLLAATFLIGGFYPITQIYQHTSDAKDGVHTISMLLGKKGTMLFCAIMYLIAFSILLHYYLVQDHVRSFIILQIFFIPVLVFFIRWTSRIWKEESAADFKHTMQMNWLASTCTSSAFLTLILLQQVG
jgi:1,4-dihydroxy-2-naphthoate octaprenyltransferase